MTSPEGLLAAFDAYERALADNDLPALAALFVDSPGTLRGDPAGLLRGHESITAFRSVRGGAPPRDLDQVEVVTIDQDHALVVAVTRARTGANGLQTQLWSRADGRWQVAAAHVSPPPVAFDPSVWRVVGDPLVPASGSGPLTGTTVAVKDLFAVRGHRVGAGVPAWLAAAREEPRHAAAVRRLLDAGAAVRRIARTDQLAYSLAGDNPHHGTPVNPVVPAGIPGGSSSGCATAVRLGDADMGLATDTAGSVRVPASYQGLWGLRTSHGCVPTDGLIGLAPDFDTVGLLTRDASLLLRSARVLLVRDGGDLLPGPLITVPGLVAGCSLGTTESFASWCAGRPVQELDLPEADAWTAAFRVRQGFQAWQQHGAFLTAHPDAVLGAPAERFRAAAAVTAAEDDRAGDVLAAARATLTALLGDAVLALPSASSAAPRLWASSEALQRLRSSTMRLTCLAGITGRPAVSAPLLEDDGAPVGLSFVGPVRSDLALVRFAEAVSAG